MKITDKDSLIEAQYSVLLKIEELNYLSENEHICVERKKIKESAFAALVAMNADGVSIKEEDIYFRDVLMSKNLFLEKYPFLRSKVLVLPIYKEKTEIFNDREEDIGQALRKEQLTNNETPAAIAAENEVEIMSEYKSQTTDEAFDEVKELINDAAESTSAETLKKNEEFEQAKKTGQIEKTEQIDAPGQMEDTTQIKLIYDKYRLEDSTMEHCETKYTKFLDTMWFNSFHITCNIRDGFMPDNFTIIVFPTEIAKDRRPLPQAVALLHDNSKKIIFSNKETGTSVEINYEDYMFAITSRFVDGKLNTKISLENRDYEITDMEEDNFSGNIIPEHFGKTLYFGDDKVEIYPLDTSNNKQSGCVSFMYKFVESDKIIYGTSEEDDSAVIATKEGGAKRISCYWAGQDSERKLNFVVD